MLLAVSLGVELFVVSGCLSVSLCDCARATTLPHTSLFICVECVLAIRRSRAHHY